VNFGYNCPSASGVQTHWGFFRQIDHYERIRLSDSCDHKPVGTARSNDWNVVTSLGCTF
jgi:hypothetical protein